MNLEREYLHQRWHVKGFQPVSYRVLARVIKTLRRNKFKFK